MNRSTPGKVARAERLERASPYARPAPSDSKIKRSSSLIAFPGIRSLVSYITHPFARSPSSKGLPFTNMDVHADQKSESGSEDGWTGDASQQMQQGDAFEQEALANSQDKLGGKSRVAEKWSAMGEKAGGRRDLARRDLEVKGANGSDLPVKSPIMPGHLTPGDTPIVPIFGGSQPHLPSLSNLTSSLKRRLSPTKAERPPPPRVVVPTFAPSTPAQNHPTSISASSVALKAFLDAKDGQPLGPEDLRVIESLTDNARQESEVGSARRSPQEVGGWAAGSFTPRPIRPLPSNYTPARPAGTAFGTPISGAGFSMGLSPAKSSATPGRHGTPGSVRYIGPGWSARRIQPQKKSNLKPLFKFDLGDEGIAKKRKIGEFEMGTGEDIPPVPTLPSSFSMPNFASSSSKPAASKSVDVEKETPSKSVQKSDPVSIGKRRAADIMLDLINAEMIESTEKATPPPFITNPYHPDAYTLVSDSRSNGQSTPASPARMGTPRRSILKLSTSSSTPLRGAAKRLEEAKNAAPTPARMTALEMLVERKSATVDEDQSGETGHDTRSKGKGKSVRLETPEMDTEEESGKVEDQIMSGEKEDETQNPDVDMDTPPTQTKTVEPEPEPFKPYTAPQLSSSTLPIPSSTPKSSFSFTPLPTSSTDGLQPAPAPKFNPSPLSQSSLPEEPKFNMGTSTPPITITPFKSSKPKDFSSIYLSAKDAALSVAKDALPFFTFFITSSGTLEPEGTKRAKEKAMKRPIEKFEFNAIEEAESSSKSISTPASASASWTCDTCMLQNPGTALEQCTICETPRSGAVAKSKATPAPISLPTPASGPWTCDTCMLSNPATAMEKCTICEAPKPSVAPTKKDGGGGGGFDWSAATGGKKAESGAKAEWTCGTCMLKNPDSAKEKCTICEAPRV